MGNAKTLADLKARHHTGVPRASRVPATQIPRPHSNGRVLWLLCKAKYANKVFMVEDLTVAAWLENKKRFGLRGYEEHYPDHNKVVALLSGDRGLVKRGLIQRLKNGYLGVADGECGE